MNPAEALPASDPTLAIAERQLAMLAELAEMAMAASRAFTTSAIAAAKAEAMILGEEWFTPEVGRARACGAKDAAESLQKVSRAVRLTLKLEMTVAEIVRDIRAGKITYIGGVAGSKDAGETPAVQLERDSADRRRPAGSSCADTPDRERLDSDREPLSEFDRPDRLPHAPVRETAETIRAELSDVAARRAARAAASQPPATPPSASPEGRSPGPARSGRPPPD